MLCLRISMGGMAPYFSSEAREMPPGSWVVVPEPSRLTKPTSQDSSAQTLNRTDSPHIGQFCTPLPTTALASSFTGMLRSSTMTTHIRPGHRSCQEQLGRTPSVRAAGKKAECQGHGPWADHRLLSVDAPAWRQPDPSHMLGFRKVG